jgi:hypothetical protein
MSANLTPPATKTKTDAPKAIVPPGEKKAAAPKAAKAPADPNAPKKDRAPRQDYGFAKDAVIKISEGEHKYRGQRAEWFTRLQASDGKTVEHFLEGNQGIKNNKGNPEPPRGWLRAFVVDGVCTLSGGTKPAPAVKTEAAAPAPAAK